jgi:hypothetical protein
MPLDPALVYCHHFGEDDNVSGMGAASPLPPYPTQPLEPLRPGERIVRSGVGELKAALLDLESRPAGVTKARKSK